ncbi:MAG: hypothetical protein ACREPI_09455 [Candidatus Dormibacterales bacterium]
MIHRAVTLVVLILASLGAFALLSDRLVSTFDARSLAALGVLVLVCAVGGVAFSWKRYRRGVSRPASRPGAYGPGGGPRSG